VSWQGILRIFQEQGSTPESLPSHLLARLASTLGACGARLVRGQQVVGEWGRLDSGLQSFALPAGRDRWEVLLAGGRPPEEELLLAAGTVLAAWHLREELKQARFAERRRLWEAEGLRAIASVLAGSLDSKACAQSLLFHSMALLDARRGEVWLSAEFPWEPGAEPEVSGSFRLVAQLGGQVLVAEEVAQAMSGWEHRERVAVPIEGRGRLLGVLALAEREVRGGVGFFSQQDVETLSLFALQAGLALEAILAYRQRWEQEKLERELALAASVQRHLVPQLPKEIPGWELASAFAPSRQVGGDLYDLLPTPRGFLLALFDVSGKGAAAALLAASLQGALRVAAKGASSLAQLAQTLDRLLQELWATHQFATASLWELGKTGEVAFLGAGHVPAIFLPASGAPRLLYPQNLPLGLVEGASFSQGSLSLERGDAVVLLTDGVVEAESSEGKELGLEALLPVLAAHQGSQLPELLARIGEKVCQHAPGSAAQDDRTLVVFRRKS